MDIEIKIVEERNLSVLTQIIRETFEKAFGPDNTAENMTHYLENNLSDEKITNEFLHPDSQFFFAWQAQEIRGYLKLNWGQAQTENTYSNGLEIERIYVNGNSQGLGIGKKLLGFAIHWARENQHNPLWLGVWEHNKGAIRFYERHGFSAFAKHPFFLGDDRQIDILMKQDLNNP